MRDIRDDSAAGGTVERTELIHKHLNNELLLDELSDWLTAQDEDNVDEAKLDALLDALEQNDPLDRTFDPKASLDAFHQAHKAEFDAIAAAQTAGDISPNIHSRFTWKKALLVAAVLALLICLVSVTATGFDFGDLFGRWSDSVFGYSEAEGEYAAIGAYPIPEGEIKAYDSLQAALDDFGVKGYIAPTWMPEGFELTRCEAERGVRGVRFYADYVSDSGQECFIKIREYDSADQLWVEKDTANTRILQHNGIAHYFVSDLDFEKATWVNGKLECMIYGQVSYEEMKIIIDSIYGG